MKIEQTIELIDYLNRANAWRRIMNKPEYDINNIDDRHKLADKLEADLSPENLTCDGELRGKILQEKTRHLSLAQKQLEFLERHEALHALYKKA